MHKNGPSDKKSVHNPESEASLSSHEEAILNDIKKTQKEPSEKIPTKNQVRSSSLFSRLLKRVTFMFPRKRPEQEPPEETTQETTEETEETTTTTTTTLIECTVILQGPKCVCVEETHTYWIEALTCRGGTCDDWKIDEPSIARIIDIQGCTVKVVILDIGKFEISAKYLFHGQRISVSKKSDAYKVEHVRGGTTDEIVKTAPLVQPHPFVQITVPAATNGSCLSSSFYKVHLEKLRQGYQSFFTGSISLEQFIRNYYEVELKLEGTISDFFIETVGVQWKINNKRSVALIKNEEFTDTTFTTKLPGEAAYNHRVVLLKGMGSFIVKVTAQNTIERKGTDWIDVFITLTESGWERIGLLKEELAVLIYNSMTNPHAGHASAILNKRNEIKNAYFEELQNPCIECLHNYQEPQSFTLETRCKTRTKVQSDSQDPLVLATVMSTFPGGPDLRLTDLLRNGVTVYLTYEPVEEYWVTKYYYSGTEFNWDEDGLLRGDRGEQLSSTYECCSDELPVFGVEIVSDDCFEVSRHDSFTLQAEGLPANSDAGPGMYSWTVITKPNDTAQVQFTPSGWNPSSVVNMKVDTSGIYTVKVSYMLGGRDCSLTYAVGDVKVFFKITDELEWRVRRIGNYHSEVDMHIDRPYYQERKQGKIRAAEMLIEPKHTGAVIGKKFTGSFVIPPELEFSEDLGIRAYYKPYDPALTSDDYEDFSGPPFIMIDPQSPMEAKVEINTKRDIYALHLIDIYYIHIMRLKGHAVPIHFVNKAPGGLACEKDEDDQPISEIFEATTTTEPERQDLPPHVNLLVYNRDLGNAQSSQGFQSLSNAHDHHNIPNGNVCLRIPFFNTGGNGENLGLYFTYNSLQASYQDSLQLVRLLNGLSYQQMCEYYCENPVGRGWTHNYNIYVKEYVKPVDQYGQLLRRYMELACPDGNRIQFMEKMGTTGGEGSAPPGSAAEFSHEFKSDHWCGSAEAGHSLKLTQRINPQGEKEHLLEDIQGHQWHFDKSGKLTKITSKFIENSSALQPLRIEYGAVTKITDTSGRELEIPFLPGQGDYTGPMILEHPDNKNSTLRFEQGWLEAIGVASTQSWVFEYYLSMGEVFPTGAQAGSFLRSVIDPRGVTNLYEYYNGDWFYQIEKDVARDFWGRFGRVLKGAGQDAREHLVRYKPLQPLIQELVYRNPGNVEFIMSFRFTEMAVVEVAYVPQLKDPISLRLLGVPNYDQSLAAGNTSIPSKSISTYDYHEGTKLIKEVTGEYGTHSTLEYFSLQDGTVYLLKKLILADGIEMQWEYNAANLVEKHFNPANASATGTGYTEYTYDNRNLLREKKYPLLEGASAPVTETWDHDASTGRLMTYTDKEGVVWTFGYGEAQRDEHNTGLATSKSMDKRKEPTQQVTLTWESTYNKMGQEIKSYEPLYGTETEMEYHGMGIISKVKQQVIETYDGRPSLGAELTYFYDGLLNLNSVFYIGGSETLEYNDHGELKKHTDASGKITEYEYHKTGEAKIISHQAGSTTQEIDELSRIVRINHPVPDTRTGELASEKFIDILLYDDDNNSVTGNRYKVAQIADGVHLPTSVLRSSTVKKYERGKLIEQTEGIGTSRLKRTFEYNAWSEVKTIRQFDSDTLKHTTTMIIDNWGRITGFTESSGSFSKTVTHILDNNGHETETIFPSFFASSGNQQPKSKILYDELERVIEVKNSYDQIVKKYIYQDFGNNDTSALLVGRVAKKTEMGQDPSRPSGQGGLLIHSESFFNRRGLCTEIYVGDSATSQLKKEMKYDSAGKLKIELDLNGKEVSFIRNAMGKPVAITTTIPVRASSVSWEQFNKNNPAHLSTQQSDILIDYDVHGNTTRQSSQAGYETTMYDAFGRVIEFRRRDGITEHMAYDALGRMIRKKIGNTVNARVTYLDNTRQVRGHYRNRHTETQLLYTYDWEEKLVSYKYETNQGAGGMGQFGEGFHLDFLYADSGKLKSKTFYNSSNQVLSKMDYEYNAAGLRESATARLSPAPGITYNNTVRYDHDAAFRLNKINSGIYNTYMFEYNHGGVLKKIGRPMLGLANEMGNTTIFEHNEKAQLLQITEKSGRDNQNRILSTIDYSYQTRIRESWEQPVPWTLENKDMLPANNPSIRGWKFRRHFAEDASTGNTVDMCVQDMAYDFAGRIMASVSQIRSTPNILTDNRYEIVNRSLTDKISLRRFREYAYNGGSMSFDGRFQVREQSLFGTSSAVFRREGKRPTLLPKTEPRGFIETMQFFGPDSLLYKKNHVQEDINIPGNDLNSQPIQNDRQYYHDALGRLVYMMERTDVRTNLTFLEPQSENDIPTANRSFPFGTSFLYGPDGEEIYRVTRGNGIPGGEVFAVTLHDHAVKVAEYDSEHRITRSFQVIPGINTVLSAISFDDHGASTSTNYYRWDARGATLYLTNFEGNVVTDFQVSAPDGSRDLFGRTIGPGGVGRPERDQQRLKELWSFYQPSGPRTDLLLANAYQLEERTERITSQGLHPSIMQGGKNNYGFSISHPHIWTTQPLESSTAGTIAQGVLDFVRGVGDTVSFGFSKYIRQKIHGQDGEVLSPAAYTGGMITGIATSLVIGFGVGAMGRAIAKAAVTGAEVTVGWGYHVGRAYVIAGDIIGVGQSSYAWANGTLTPLDCLGFLPMVGWTAGRFKDHIKVIGKGIMYGIQKMPSGLKIGVTAGSEMAAIHHFSEAVHAGVVNAMKYVQIHRPREYLRLATGRSQGHHPFFRYIIRGFFPEEMSIVQRELYHHAANLQTLVPLRNSDHQLLHYAFDGAYPALAGNNILLHGAGRYGGGTARIRQAIANGSTQEQIADQLDEFYRIAYADDPALRDQFLAVTLQVRNFLGC